MVMKHSAVSDTNCDPALYAFTRGEYSERGCGQSRDSVSYHAIASILCYSVIEISTQVSGTKLRG